MYPPSLLEDRPVLPQRFLLLRTMDIAEAHAVVAGLYAPFDWSLSRNRRRGSHPVSVHAVRSGSLNVATLAYGHEVDIRPDHVGCGLLVTTVLAGEVSQTWRDGRYAGGTAGQIFLTSNDNRPTFHYSASAEVLKVSLPQQKIDALCWQWMGRRGTSPVRFCLPKVESGASRPWLLLLDYLIRNLDAPPETQTLLSERIEELLILHLLANVTHNYSDRVLHAATTTREYRRARSFVEDHLCESLTLADIARAAGCSIRSLTRAFQLAGDVSPMRFLQELRLQRIHSALCHGTETHVTIADIALHWGFGHVGEFNRQYRIRFGESPSQTRERIVS
ncbi:AraC family transcriptional regulator [Paraburkholderia unamae]|uniref:AraC-like DNA-binding protein n=1 Tax=Paraburkholderia unamae TaxID=219649 RepID=A0ABX5KX40_9BURK|nr:AraC family transcriptional regulator [Paraburkholderia unamae]PVX85650.1 AraC-like DNA-binding protein [Paraburkholderia unamae]